MGTGSGAPPRPRRAEARGVLNGAGTAGEQRAASSDEPRFLVTGAHGCIGAWVVQELLTDGRSVTTFDLSSEPRRLGLLLGDRAAEVPHVVGDITDRGSLEAAVDEHGISNVIHLAALQVPLVRANPTLGASVNVVGTINVFEAAARRRLAPIVYASSIAAYDPEGTMHGQPGTLYGVFKRTNELAAAVYHREQGVASIGLRPHTVYGVGRDQGITSAPTLAMLAAAAGTRYEIPYSGIAQLQFARDVARVFIAASLANGDSAVVHNVPGRPTSIAELVAKITEAAPASDGTITYTDTVLPFPGELPSESFATVVPDYLETPLDEGVQTTIDRFRALLERGLVTPPPSLGTH